MFQEIFSGAPSGHVPEGAAVLGCDRANGVIYIGSALGWNPNLRSVADGLTAHTGGGQANATKITTQFARFSTVALAGNSAVLPVSVPGTAITVGNAGANSMDVFPVSGEIINALAANTAYAVTNGSATEFVCVKAGYWQTVGAAPVAPTVVLPTVVASVSLTNISSSSSGNALYTTVGAGVFRASIFQSVRTGAASGTLGSSVQFTYLAHATSVPTLGTANANAGADYPDMELFTFHADAGTAITYGLNVTNATGNARFILDLVLEQLA